MITVTIRHEISVGHTIIGTTDWCSVLHGHSYTVSFTVRRLPQGNPLQHDAVDDVGYVIARSELRARLCTWLDKNWNHRFLVHDQDDCRQRLMEIDRNVVWTPFNPTPENMAEYLLMMAGPMVIAGTGCQLVEVKIETGNLVVTATP